MKTHKTLRYSNNIAKFDGEILLVLKYRHEKEIGGEYL